MKKTIPTLTGLALLASAGCATMPPPQEFELSSTRIHCDSTENISEQYYKLRPLPSNFFGDLIQGYNWVDGVHVMWSGEYDKNGEPLPDFEVLGHEIWHRIKGDYHR